MNLIEDYIEVFDQLPPVVIDRETGTLIDGFHRVEAAKQLGRTEIAVTEIDVLDGNYFAMACQLNCKHGFQLTRQEKHDAIVRLYQDGYNQEVLGKMWGYSQVMVSYILGAEIRNRRLDLANVNNLHSPITPSQESIIRQAPPEVQDTIAELIATRVEEVSPTKQEIVESVKQGKPVPKQERPKKVKVSQVRTLVEEAKYTPERFQETVEKMRSDPSELVATRIFDRGSHSIPVHSTPLGLPYPIG